MKLKFIGAARTVTGSKILCETKNSKFLVDAGLFQGSNQNRLLNWELDFNPKVLDFVILTHAHIDHSGLLPKLYREGMNCPIYSTKGTFELAEILLKDSAHLQEEDAEYANKTGHSSHKPALPLYTVKDAENVLALFKILPRDEWHDVGNDIKIRFLRSGHIIGSSFVQIQISEKNESQIITFSGDIGNSRSQIIKPPVTITETDFLIMEATYGNRLQVRISAEELMKRYLNIVLKRKGVMIIPAFSVGRTQEILFLINKLMEAKVINEVPVYVDSPMSASANRIFMDNPDDHVLKIENDQLVSPILPPSYHEVLSVAESKNISKQKGPMIIVTASGMISGGRVLHHLKDRLPYKENGVLFVGYQAEETKGRLLIEGIEKIRIFHKEVPVNADIFNIDGLSAHGDYLDILEWLASLKKSPKLIILNHGETKALNHLKMLIESEYDYKVAIAEPGEEVDTNNVSLSA
ncbi:MAG: MBL fold metallo-hydrolase [Bdellovibrio sp.]|nr:MBL fold metallo-hydrolase [Bdellovibrio sp.]